MRNKYAANHVLLRDSVFFYVRRVPLDLAEYYSVKRLCFSLRSVVQCPSDMIDQIGGWATAGVGQSKERDTG